MSYFPCTGNSILELNYASFAGYYSQVIQTIPTGHEKSNFFGINLWSKIFNLATENAGNGMSELLRLQIFSWGRPQTSPTSQQSELTCERFDASEVINA